MTPERYEQIRRIFGFLCDLSGQEQRFYLNTCCADDANLKKELESLLLEDADPGCECRIEVAFRELKNACRNVLAAENW